MNLVQFKHFLVLAALATPGQSSSSNGFYFRAFNELNNTIV